MEQLVNLIILSETIAMLWKLSWIKELIKFSAVTTGKEIHLPDRSYFKTKNLQE